MSFVNMSKLFYDKLASLNKLEKYINKVADDFEERHELWHIVDEVIHHKVLHCVLDELPEKHHEEFLVKLYEAPHDEGLLDYLTEKIKKDAKEFIQREIASVSHEILKDIKNHHKRISGNKKK